jgi:hypothetical protein
MPKHEKVIKKEKKDEVKIKKATSPLSQSSNDASPPDTSSLKNLLIELSDSEKSE